MASYGHVRRRFRKRLRKLCTEYFDIPPKPLSADFSKARPLDFVAMDILGPCFIKKQQNQYILVATDRYLKSTHKVLSSKKTSTQIANFSFDHWLVPIDILTNHSTHSQVNFKGKLIPTKSLLLGLKNLTATVYHARTNNHPSQNIRQEYSHPPGHYVTEHQKQ